MRSRTWGVGARALPEPEKLPAPGEYRKKQTQKPPQPCWAEEKWGRAIELLGVSEELGQGLGTVK